MRRSLPIALCLLWTASLATPVAAQSAPFPKIPMAWFEETEQHAPHWKVTLGDTTLLYSQRFVVHANAVIPAKIKKHDRDAQWHVILRVADGNGKWFEGSDYSYIEWKGVPPKIESLSYSNNFFARPGSYRIVLLIYDAASEKHYLWRKSITLDRPDVLPELDRDMPMVEFISAGRPHAPTGEYLPIHNRKPVRIDVVLNLTGERQLGLHADIFSWIRQTYVEGTLQGASGVFSQLKPEAGCVRMSAVDILHLSTALDREAANPEADWRSVREAIIKNRDTSKVDVRTLTGRTKARAFFHQFLDAVISDNTGCGGADPGVERAIVIVSDSLEFPKGADNEPVTARDLRGEHFYHVKIASNMVATFDQVGHMLDPLHPKRFDVTTPRQLRHAVAEIIRDVEGFSRGQSGE